MFIIVSYDIPNNKRRRRICRTVLNFGDRVQKSVFECYLSEEDFERLKAAVQKLIKSGEDNVRYYVLCQGCEKRVEVTLGERPSEPGKVLFG